MKRNLAARTLLRAVAGRCAALACFLLFAGSVLAQSTPPANSALQAHSGAHQVSHNPRQARETIPALLVSDIHFEPFWDPARAAQLATAPVSKWTAILAATPSSDREQRFQALQQGCHVRGADTSFALYESSLKAMRTQAARVGFVTVSGDLLSHSFQCKFEALFPHSSPEALHTFAEKTLDYVVGELYRSFPRVPVYVALGNNDSDCGDYQLDAHSQFLETSGREVTKNFPASERPSAQKDFAAGGYYSVSLPAPIKNARLLVLNDIFMANSFQTCSGKADSTGADAQLAWLARQLAEARAHQQKIWVMGHIPPGVDLHATVRRMAGVCSGQPPKMFLSSEKLANLLAGYGDVVQLAIFAHTHMDEMRLLKPESGGGSSASANGVEAKTAQGVAVKMVPSISPINGNSPSFTLAQVDPSTAALMDYKVFTASNQTGVDEIWKEEYDFARSFHEADFSSSSVSELMRGFAADPSAKTEASQNYIQDFSSGYLSPVLQAFWPQYVCTLSNNTVQAFRACVCPAAQ
jgi:sphingomyelin phosphodiesterase acid-like 3